MTRSGSGAEGSPSSTHGQGIVHIDERKWPDRLHWQLPAIRIGEDQYGVWLSVRRGTIARRGAEPPVAIPYGFVMLVPDDEPWVVEFYPEHPKHPVYVNIGTVPQWEGDRVTQVDLDLDVIRTPAGTTEVLDEDEFLDHQVRFEYPAPIIANARSAVARCLELLSSGTEPFGVASTRWMDLTAP